MERDIELAVLQLGAAPSVLAITPSPSIREQKAEFPTVSEDIPDRGQDFLFLMGNRVPGLMAKLCPQMPSVGL